MRVTIVRTMPAFSMDVYADGLIAGLKAVRPDWEIVEMSPYPLDRTSSSLWVRLRKYYERFWHFPQTVSQQTADIFHIIDHSEAHIAYWLKKTGKPVVVTCHDLINFFNLENVRKSVHLPFISHATWKYSVNAMQDADRAIAISTKTAKDLMQLLSIESRRITVVPNAVGAEFYPILPAESAAIRQQYGLSSTDLCLLNVGLSHPRKNLMTVLKVVEVLQQQGLAVKLLKVGADFTAEQKLFVTTHGLKENIIYLGKLDKQSLVGVYNAADLLLAPSLLEGFGMTLLEAMACGTPVIASNVSPTPEVAGDAAILVEPMDCQAIVAAVCHLHNNSHYRQQLIDLGLKRARSFTWENTAEQIAAVYERAIA